MKFEYYQHLKKIILFIETLLSPVIDINKLQEVEKILIEFVKEVSDLYPLSIMLSGMHELLHLIDCTLDFGPLNSTNCFQFEELNRKLMRFLHGHDLIGEELIKIFSTAQTLSQFSINIQNNQLKEFIKKRLNFRSSNKKKLTSKIEIKILDKLDESNNRLYLEMFYRFSNLSLNNVQICHKILNNGVFFTSHYIKTKRLDSCFINHKNQIGLIECFLIVNNIVYVLAKRIIKSFNAFYSPRFPSISSNSFVCYISDQYFVEEIKYIKKTNLMYVSDNNCFVSLFSTSHLFN